MKTKSDFFIIEEEHLKEKTLFSFHLYIFNPQNKKFNTFLFANSPLSYEKKSFLNFILDRGGKLAVLVKQQRTFLRAQQLMKDEVPSLKKPPPHPMEIEQEKYKLAMEDSSSFDFPSKIKLCISKDDF
ncbi:MAG: hypothetical protein VXW15_07705 [Bdellovibrionota bacterium]|nr:hypothetical protein [Bdellovibrionota bacterium]